MKTHLLLSLLILTSCTSIEYNDGIEAFNNSIEVFFCSKINCNKVLTKLIKKSDQVSCAMYKINNEHINNLLKDSILTTHHKNKEGLMHNKFCIFDKNMVWTGSLNPSKQENSANNAVIIKSGYIANNYLSELDEIINNLPQKKTKHKKVLLNGILVENYFCPEDKCQQKVLNTLKKVKNEILFMTFSFTDDFIGNFILEKIREGIIVKGIFDKSQLSKWSEYYKLKNNSKTLRLHHKVFVIDRKIVITGSYNPTLNGNTKNDENILIIHNPEIAGKYLEEFNKLWAKANTPLK